MVFVSNTSYFILANDRGSLQASLYLYGFQGLAFYGILSVTTSQYQTL